MGFFFKQNSMEKMSPAHNVSLKAGIMGSREQEGAGWKLFCHTSDIRVQRLRRSDYLLSLSACPWKPMMRGYHSCEVKVGFLQHAASHDQLHNPKEQHCMPYKETPVLVLGKAPLLVLRQSRQLLEDHLVPGKEVEAKIIVASEILALDFNQIQPNLPHLVVVRPKWRRSECKLLWATFGKKGGFEWISN